MTMLIRNATLPDGRTGIDVLVEADRIKAVGPNLPLLEGVPLIEAGGLLLSPPFVDAHFHMDATLSYGLPRVNQSGTLLEGIALWGELKSQYCRARSTSASCVSCGLSSPHSVMPSSSVPLSFTRGRP